MADDALHWRGVPIGAVTAWPCLDFVNTIEWRLSDRSDRNEFLGDYTNLVQWARHDGLVTEAEARVTLSVAAIRVEEATAAYQRAIRLRETLAMIFSAVAHAAAAPVDALKDLNAALAEATVPMRLVSTPQGYRREWLDARDDLGWFLQPVVRSAADLLISAELVRLKECPGGPGRACGFIFFDETKNRSRRWCSGRTCGNRTRLHRHYARRQAEEEPAT